MRRRSISILIVLAALVFVLVMLGFIRQGLPAVPPQTPSLTSVASVAVDPTGQRGESPATGDEPDSVSVIMSETTPTLMPTLDCSPYSTGTPFRTTPSPLEECWLFNLAPDERKLFITEEVVAYFPVPGYHLTRESSPAYLRHIPTTSVVSLGWSAEIRFTVYYAEEARRELEAVLNDPALMAPVRAHIETLEAQLPTPTP